MIAQNEVNVQGEFANKNDNFNLNNGAYMINPYPIVEVKHIWQVYVTSELKIKLFCFFTIPAMVWIFIAVKKKYLDIWAVLKFIKTQNEATRAKTKWRNPQPATKIHDQIFLNMSTKRQILRIPLLMEETLFA